MDRSVSEQLDREDPLQHLRAQFIIPTKGDLSRKTLAPDTAPQDADNEESVYLCGNSLGLQPRHVRDYFDQYLSTWAAKGVYGHTRRLEDSRLAPWLDVDDDVQADMATIVGALPTEVALMATLTANLHLLMTSFYRPSAERYKVILEGKAFPSDHYAVESQILIRGLDPEKAMVLVEPEITGSPLISTEQILRVIDQHASETALLLLPGIHYYSGQLFDIPRITAHAQAQGIVVGWDLAHAAGNVPLTLHESNVDFAVWCTYKYLNCGPGAIGACFVHEKHGQVSEMATVDGSPSFQYRPRLSGWWGSSKAGRFDMANTFEPIVGTTGYSVSNPSVADTTAVRASLDIFKQTTMADLRQKSLKLTGYLQDLLDVLLRDLGTEDTFQIITPRHSEERGAQISVMLAPGLLDAVMASLEAQGVVVDERRPDVVRVAPTPLYNSFTDVWNFVQAFSRALIEAKKQSV